MEFMRAGAERLLRYGYDIPAAPRAKTTRPKPAEKPMSLNDMKLRFWDNLVQAQRRATKAFPRWDLRPDLYLLADCKRIRSVKFMNRHGEPCSHQYRRDVKVPRPHFWPSGTIPSGPQLYDPTRGCEPWTG